MSWHPETNPHFINTPLQQREGQPSQTPPSPGGPSSGRQDQQNQPPEGPQVTRSRSKGRGSKKKGASVVKPEHEGQFRSPWIPPAKQHPGQHPESHFPLHGNEVQSPPTRPPQYQRPPYIPLQQGRFESPWAFPQHGDPHPQPPGPKHDSEPHVPPRNQDQDRGPRVTFPQPQERNPQQSTGIVGRPAQFSGLPKPGGTKPLIWLGAVFCAILWIVIFLGGLIVLVVYLVYRPRSPRFDVSSASLNMAYIDAGSLLNADLNVLANFTNPNKKVSVDFSYMIIDLHYGSTLIATQYIEPFSAERAESRFVNVHMVTSQVRLPVLESARLQEQISKNGAIFDVKGVFRVRSKLGTLLKYSYRLYGHCTILVTAPPSGVLRATKCRTKR
ncbi:PREDICTED: uncharacterized protein LOC105138081 [Populus euphratica]|uniref:Uncharacterized protein LOC105138081 n=1 Tax=Populus euphratica TaxID=75702 RepID=A0AAJ6V6A7_POPEU|nr:PREDICTED: uncharacterized protein LOC105138081 [Populus euphratica]